MCGSSLQGKSTITPAISPLHPARSRSAAWRSWAVNTVLNLLNKCHLFPHRKKKKKKNLKHPLERAYELETIPSPPATAASQFILRERLAADETCLSFWRSGWRRKHIVVLSGWQSCDTLSTRKHLIWVAHTWPVLMPRRRPVRLAVPCRTQEGQRGALTELECDFWGRLVCLMCWLNVKCVWL